ncbi:hypothetical protein MNBD_GAMMA13-789 [hydrothermal vent metagenome]|uniref:Uncharacterized protein n=1 Tax=hydrothermal vent metagenome TaxID=652676 RepID=A0A3B0YEV3_9ZZZZ
MNASKHLIALAIAATTVASQGAMAQETAEDSAYQWGRWAVLSPAAGGQPYQAHLAPGADNNYRPGDFFDPELQAQVAPSIAIPNPPGGLPPPVTVPNPPGSLPPGGDPRGGITTPPVAIQNPPGGLPPGGDPRGGNSTITPPVAVPNPGGQPPGGGPRGT